MTNINLSFLGCYVTAPLDVMLARNKETGTLISGTEISFYIDLSKSCGHNLSFSYRNLLPLQEFYFFILFNGIVLIDLDDLLA